MRADKFVLLTTVAGVLFAGWLILGCEGPEGPAGPPGPGLTGEARYAGDDANTCGHCHGDLTEGWAGTGHAGAWVALAADTTNLYCVQCHSTGFDDRYDHSGNLLSTGVNNGGYDDTHDPKLVGVQCEACHGPMGVNPAVHTPQVESSFRGETCAFCHQQPTEWVNSGHGSVLTRMTREEMVTEWGSSSCNSCHISEGFIKKYDPDHANLSFNDETANPVTCATCHDPHSADNPSQLRTVASVRLPYGGEDSTAGYTIASFGRGQLCAQCHHARRSRSQIVAQIDTGSVHPGPHESPQADMVSGHGSWEVPGTYIRETYHAGLADMCVNCHMYTIPRDQTGGPVFGHSFKPDVRKCQQCHTELVDNFDHNGVQTRIEAKLVELALLLPNDGVGNVLTEMDTLNWTRAQREAGYVYLFVRNDGSMGVHNSRYADSLLTNAIRYLTPRAVSQTPLPGVRG